MNYQEEVLKTLKSIEKLLQDLNKKVIVPDITIAPYFGDVPPYRPVPYWPYNRVTWKTTDSAKELD